MDNERVFVLALIGLLAFVSWLMVKPFLAYVLFAVILAFVLRPLQRKLSSYINSSVSAFLLMTFAILVAVLPLVFATVAVVEDAQDLTQDINQTDLVNATEVELYFQRYTGQSIDVEKTVNSAISQFTSATFGSFSQFVNLIASLAIGLTLMLFLLFYFLRDGDEMAVWLKDIIPLDSETKDRLYDKINITTWAVIKGHVLVAVAQGLVAGLGLAATGVPNYVFWTFMMVLLGFIPLIGSILVWGPAAVYLFVTGQTGLGIFLLIYGLVVVGLTDNILRPIVVDKRAELHPSVIIVGVIGGVYIFGAPGLFFGPILLGVFKAILEVFRDNSEV